MSPRGIYTRTDKHLQLLAKMRERLHKSGCRCISCKSKRGEPHSYNCQCICCKDQREKGVQNRGAKNGLWKDDKANVSSKHEYIRRHYGSANHCVNPNCAKTSKRFQWTKIDHNTPYTRNVEEYQQLCEKCHRGYDFRKIRINGRYGR